VCAVDQTRFVLLVCETMRKVPVIPVTSKFALLAGPLDDVWKTTALL